MNRFNPNFRTALWATIVPLALLAAAPAAATVTVIPQSALTPSTTYFTDLIGGGLGPIAVMTGGGNAANVGRILRSLENTTAAADLRAGLNGYLNGLCRTDADAKNLGDAARGLVGLGRLSVPEKQPELLRLWDGIKVDQQQRAVKITVAIPQYLIDKLIDLVESDPRLHALPVTSR